MKVVILAGGFGTRLAEETHARPKPMIEIGGMPLLVHIMKIYSHYGFNDFVICLGYMGYSIKEYFSNYALHRTDVTYDFATGEHRFYNSQAEPWRVTLIDTGPATMTGGRLKRVAEHVRGETFMMTYGDGVADIDLHALVATHRAHGRPATVTAVQPAGRFGVLKLTDDGAVAAFREKPQDEIGWINGGFMVLEPEALQFIENDDSSLEANALERLAGARQLAAYRHEGFWQCMDTLREKRLLESHWQANTAAWKVWK